MRKLILVSILLASCAPKPGENPAATPKPAAQCEVISESENVLWLDGQRRQSQVVRCPFGSETCIVFRTPTALDLRCELTDWRDAL